MSAASMRHHGDCLDWVRSVGVCRWAGLELGRVDGGRSSLCWMIVFDLDSGRSLTKPARFQSDAALRWPAASIDRKDAAPDSVPSWNCASLPIFGFAVGPEAQNQPPRILLPAVVGAIDRLTDAAADTSAFCGSLNGRIVAAIEEETWVPHPHHLYCRLRHWPAAGYRVVAGLGIAVGESPSSLILILAGWVVVATHVLAGVEMEIVGNSKDTGETRSEDLPTLLPDQRQ